MTHQLAMWISPERVVFKFPVLSKAEIAVVAVDRGSPVALLNNTWEWLLDLFTTTQRAHHYYVTLFPRLLCQSFTCMLPWGQQSKIVSRPHYHIPLIVLPETRARSADKEKEEEEREKNERSLNPFCSLHCHMRGKKKWERACVWWYWGGVGVEGSWGWRRTELITE